jgi:plasmid stabilization system protein ParE
MPAATRFLVQGDYLILYAARAHDVYILRIVHGSRELDQLSASDQDGDDSP